MNSNGLPRQYLPKQTDPRRYGRDGDDLAAVEPT
jgi:IS30 family transposase